MQSAQSICMYIFIYYIEEEKEREREREMHIAACHTHPLLNFSPSKWSQNFI